MKAKNRFTRAYQGAFLFFGFFFVYLFTTSVETPLQGDGGRMFTDAERMIERGFAPTMPDGRPTFSKYQPGQPFLDLSVVWLRRVFVSETDPVWRLLMRLGISALPSAIGASTCLLVFLSCARLGASASAAIVAALVTGLCTMVFGYTQTLFSDPTLGPLWLLTFYGLLSFRDSGKTRWLLLAGAGAGYAVLTKVMAGAPLIVFGGYALYLLFCRRASKPGRLAGGALAFGLPILVCVGVLLWYNDLRYGSPLTFGHTADVNGATDPRDSLFGFDVPLWTGLFGLLLSPGKGVFWYNPVLFIGLAGIPLFWRRGRAETAVCFGVFGAILLAHAKWWGWHGDWAWGPRYLVGVVPFLCLPAAFWFDRFLERWRARRRRFRPSHVAAAAVIVLSLCIQISSVSVSYLSYLGLVTVHTRFFPEIHYVQKSWPIQNSAMHAHFIPEFSPLVGHPWMMRCIWERDTPEGEALRRSPPWIALNPKWLPENYNVDAYFHWNIWWAFYWQSKTDLWHVAMIAGTLLVLGLFCLGAALRSAWRP